MFAQILWNEWCEIEWKIDDCGREKKKMIVRKVKSQFKQPNIEKKDQTETGKYS